MHCCPVSPQLVGRSCATVASLLSHTYQSWSKVRKVGQPPREVAILLAVWRDITPLDHSATKLQYGTVLMHKCTHGPKILRWISSRRNRRYANTYALAL